SRRRLESVTDPGTEVSSCAKRALLGVRLARTNSPAPAAAARPRAIRPPKWPVAPAMRTFTGRERSPALQELPQRGPAPDEPRRDEIADHAHQRLEQRRTLGQAMRDPVGQPAPRDDELESARDPLLVAHHAPRPRVAAEGAARHVA